LFGLNAIFLWDINSKGLKLTRLLARLDGCKKGARCHVKFGPGIISDLSISDKTQVGLMVIQNDGQTTAYCNKQADYANSCIFIPMF
jgi:hypothetical protein